MFLKFSLVSLLTLSAFAQVQTVPVRITSTPEPISSLYPVLHVKNIGLHTVRMCNQGAVAVTMPPEVVFMGLHELPAISIDRAEVLITDAYNHNPKFTLARLAEYGLVVAGIVTSGGIGGIVAVSAKVSGGIVAGIGVAHVVGDKLKGEVPLLGPFLGSTLSDSVTLAPAGVAGYCATKTIFTGIIKGVHSLDVTVAVPVAPQLVTKPLALTQNEREDLLAMIRGMSLSAD
jgi:hypothetical protein